MVDEAVGGGHINGGASPGSAKYVLRLSLADLGRRSKQE